MTGEWIANRLHETENFVIGMTIHREDWELIAPALADLIEVLTIATPPGELPNGPDHPLPDC